MINHIFLRYSINPKHTKIESTTASSEGEKVDSQQDTSNAPSETSDFRMKFLNGNASGYSYIKNELKNLLNSLSPSYEKLGYSPLDAYCKLQNPVSQYSKNKGNSTFKDLAMKLNEEGPLIASGDQSRIWMESFYINGRTKSIKEAAGSVDKDLGIMVGGQFASLTNGWILGVYSGTAQGQVHGTDDKRNKTKQGQKFTTLYHSRSFKGGFRYDLILQAISASENINRLTASQQIALGTRKSSTYNGNVEISQVIKLKEHVSLRPSLGVNLSNQLIKGYTESGSNQNYCYSSTSSKAREVYGGVGLRRQWKTLEHKDLFVAKLTGLYELGYEAFYKGPSGTTTVINTGQTSEGSAYSTGKLSHKLTLTGSVQHNQLKIIGSCSATLKKYRQKTMFTLKAEWRF